MVLDRSYAITLRTRIGISKEHEKKFQSWIEKQHHGVWVYEKEGNELHIHAQIWLEDSKRKKGKIVEVLRNQIKSTYKPDEYILDHAICVTHAVNDDWSEEYIRKENELKYDNQPLIYGDERKLKYYPTDEEYAEILARKDKTREGIKNWNVYSELERLWNEDVEKGMMPEYTKYFVAGWLSKQMNSLRTIKPESDKRKRISMLNMFLAYLTKSEDPAFFLSKEDTEQLQKLEAMIV